MDLERQIFLEENDIKPNKHVARTMIVVTIFLAFIEIINDLGIFYVNPLNMRVALLATAIATVLTIFISKSKHFTNRGSGKYVIICLLLFAVNLDVILLEQWATLALLLPLVLACQYHDKIVTWITVVVTCIMALTSSAISCLMGYWDNEFWQILINSSGYDTGQLTPMTDYSASDYIWKIILYLGVPRLLIVIALSTILFSLTKIVSDNINNRVEATYYSRVDVLTGLWNRMSYEKMLDEFDSSAESDNVETQAKATICIYADANGLHDLNDEQGHEAGDKLLQACANAMKQELGDECYRIGGDEFAAIVRDMDLDTLKGKINNIHENLSKGGYNMSIGFCLFSCDSEASLRKSMRMAEDMMYDEKEKYYQETGKTRR